MIWFLHNLQPAILDLQPDYKGILINITNAGAQSTGLRISCGKITVSESGEAVLNVGLVAE